MPRFMVFAWLTAWAVPCLPAAEWTTTSLDGQVAIAMSLDGEGAIRYRVTHHGKPTILDSRLGFESAAPELNLLGRFELVATRETSHASEWLPVYGERTRIPDRYRARVVELRQRSGNTRLTVELRAYNEGAALRYTFPDAGRAPGAPLALAAERTEFRFPPGTHGYEEIGPEGEYTRKPVELILPNCERPLTLELADGRFACLLEANLDRYPRMLLSPSPFTPGALASALGSPVTIPAGESFSTPWRVLIVGDKPGDLLERNYLVLNLNPPNALADSTWIKPGKSIREITLSTPGGKACVDFAVAHGFSYVLYDAGWYGHEYDDAADARGVNLDPQRVGRIPNHPGLDLKEVIAYGKRRGIGIFLYVNRRALERQLDELLPLYAGWGVAGVKFGFVNVGPQQWTTWLLEAVRKAAAHKLLVDIHDNYRPTGFSRTYPNLLTQEGIRGNEHMPTATHNTLLPFTRLPAGPGDYTIAIFSQRIKPTRAHQLALAVTGYSPLQHLYWYDTPGLFNGEPELAFLDQVPTTWDDTRVVDAKLGEFATIARNRREDWFIGTITGDAAGGRRVEIPLRFLPPGKKFLAHVYENADDPKVTQIRTEVVDATTVLLAKLPAAGGQAVRLSPAPR